MADKEYRFEVGVSNASRNDLGTVTGKFGSGTVANFTTETCPAGFICMALGSLPLEGYEETSKKNGNSYYMVKAAKGVVDGYTGDFTGLYACNDYAGNKATDGVNVFNAYGRSLGLTVPAGERADFTAIYVGDKHNFGKDNFTNTVTNITTTPYAIIANGLFTATATKPTDGSVYAEIVDIGSRYIEGCYDAGQKITLLFKRSTKAS